MKTKNKSLFHTFLAEKNFTFTKEVDEKLKKIRFDLMVDLTEYGQNIREQIDLELSPHLKDQHKLSVLWNIRFNIITNVEYIDHYENILKRDLNNTFSIADNDDFLYFAAAHQILANKTSAFEVLKMVVKVKTIEWMIENDYNDIVKVKFIKPYNKDHLNIFTPYGYELFLYLDREYFNKNPAIKYSNIYHVMKGNIKGKIKASLKGYQLWLIPKIGKNISKIYSTYNDNDVLENLIKEYIKTNQDLQ